MKRLFSWEFSIPPGAFETEWAFVGAATGRPQAMPDGVKACFDAAGKRIRRCNPFIRG